MRTIKKILLVISIIFLAYSCKKEMIDFQGENGVYFEMHKKTPTGIGVGQWTDTTSITFASTRKNDSISDVKLMLFGRVTNYDRTVNIKIIDTATTVISGVDYETFSPKIVFPAGKEFAIFRIKFMRNESLLNEHKFLTIELAHSPDFPFQLKTYQSANNNTGAQDVEVEDITKHTFDVSDALFMPAVWNDGYFGKYSDYKFQYINEKYSLTQDDWSSLEKMPHNRMTYMGKNMKRYLLEQDAAGMPVYEKDRKGDIIYQKNSKGEYLLDKDGNKIPVKLTMGTRV